MNLNLQFNIHFESILGLDLALRHPSTELIVQLAMQNTKQILEPSKCEPATYEYEKSSFSGIYEVLQSLRE